MLAHDLSRQRRTQSMNTQPEDGEDDGEWLHVRMQHRSDSVPVRISRRALEEHFGALDGQRTLIFLYVNNRELIHRTARAKMNPGERYTAECPLELRASDFVASLGASDARTSVGPPEDLQHALDRVAAAVQPGESVIGNYVRWKAETGRVELTGIFSADQLERIARFMRQSLNERPRADADEEEGRDN